jgi:hypothetical protein
MNSINTITEDSVFQKGKEYNIQLLSELVYFEIVEKITKKTLLKLEAFDNFEHMPELIEEEKEELTTDGKFSQSLIELKNKENVIFNSVYSNYQWVLFNFKNCYFIIFLQKRKTSLQINRNFIKLSEFLEEFDFFKNYNTQLNTLITNYFLKIIEKNSLVTKLEKEEIKVPNDFNYTTKSHFESDLEIDLSIDEIDLKFFTEKNKSNIFGIKKFLLGVIFLLFVFFISVYLTMSQNSKRSEIVKIDATNAIKDLKI